MSRLLPHPILSAALAATWLLLNAPPSPGSLVLAVAAGLTIPAVMRALRPAPVRLRRPWALLRLAGLVLADMVRSNLDVARIILSPDQAGRRTGFVSIPLELRDPFGLTLLAIMLTVTPGTLWVQYDSDTGRLLLHVLDDTGDDGWVRRVKERYERPLLEIFA
ncbi:Na+/H+ antiporter subunit E [Methylobacterium aerolatum]|uniref:Multicomponent K+:H+ antiporter subunit E n=1 Tax=Methylobacterium aerolatum TaxID=418708 RepID=A0ABU0HTD8_9HYPH|nr:Na+/H+ antiporter subunit E [Methylobacterium aerolatum]MDQ0445593.1 multicomponent K+:H+ antiporter subunit E [Methylobacterium aerolatum]GJD36296.1 Na(+)/H(+) antiporter subunit E [Methylobacterium aerolatum]